MHEAEHLGILGVVHDGLEAALVVVHVLLQLAALHVKDVDEDLARIIKIMTYWYEL